MNNLENNKLIAEFMGGKTHKDVSYEIGFHMGKNDIWIPIHGIKPIHSLKYDTDWNWLMEVVEKYDNYISDNNLDEWVTDFNYALSAINISILYKTCIEFIKWYNLNKLS